MRTRCIILTSLLLIWLPVAIMAAEYHVKQDETGDFTTIQAAIDAALDGDTVIVHPGTYYENIEFKGKNIVLRSVAPEDEQTVASTIIDGDQKGTVVRFAGTEDETCLLSGFTVRNGKADAANGGGVGGGRYPEYTHAAISNCTISDNSADIGGGLLHCDGTIGNCSISNNSVAGSGGGLLYCNGTVSNCTISDNSAVRNGGGLDWCDGTIRDCIISGNRGYSGAGLYACDATISNCTISDNVAESEGGGLCWCDGTISNCTISRNQVEYYGGGLAHCDGTISNCTISGNSANYGSGLCLTRGAISNCIVWGNSAGSEGKQLSDCQADVITFCCIQGWTAGGEGNISVDPLFVSGPLGDYYLSQTAAGQTGDSPCVDAGSMLAVEAGLAEMTTRTDEMHDAGVVDIGYHYPTAEKDVDVSCSLNEHEFVPDDVFQGFMSVENRGADVVVDIFAILLLPDGSMISLTQSGLAVGIWPWYADLTLPSGFAAGPEMVFELIIPADAAPGNYAYFAAISRAGTGPSAILSVDQCPFEISEQVGSHYYVDGQLGDDANDGSEDAPWRTITRALDSLEGNDAHPATIHVAAGTYSASTNGEMFPLNMKSWVSVVGNNIVDMGFHYRIP